MLRERKGRRLFGPDLAEPPFTLHDHAGHNGPRTFPFLRRWLLKRRGTIMLRTFVIALCTAAPAVAFASSDENTKASERANVADPQATVAADAADIGEADVVSDGALVVMDSEFVLPTLNIPVYALDSYDLVDKNGDDVGHVQRVVGLDENTATAVVVEFDGPGWFFNDGDVSRVVDLSLFAIEDDRLIMDIGPDGELELPVYKD